MARLRRGGYKAAFLSILLVTNGVVGCGGSTKIHQPYSEYPIGYEERGIASWYGPGFHGNRTASGERFDKNRLTAAHRTLPMGMIVRVRSLSTGLYVTVRINDRGPFAKGRIIDLSEAAARLLGLIGAGTDAVVLRVTGYEGGSGAMGFLRVQVASFAEHGPAKALADQLKDRYADVRIMAVDLSSGRRYRVQVGRFSSEWQASTVAREVNAQFNVESVVVRDEV